MLAHVYRRCYPRPMRSIFLAAPIFMGLSLTAATLPVEPVVTSLSSVNFTFTRPSLGAADGGVTVAGRVCRKPNRALPMPGRLQIERLDATGAVVETVGALLPPGTNRVDQPCVAYRGRLAGPVAPDDSIRLCFGRGRKACA
jgi:hypothetical protein